MEASSKKDVLYSRCLSAARASPQGLDYVFYQNDLTVMGIADNPSDLLAICQDLVASHLFQAMTMDGVLVWRVREREGAGKLAALTSDERLIYGHIESTSTTGIWTKALKAKTNLHQTVMTRALKSLETKRLIKPIKSVKYPARKIYMLSHLIPSEDVTGGPWFADGELDLDLIEALTDPILHWVQARSWKEAPRVTQSVVARKKLEKEKAMAAANKGSSGVPDIEEPKYTPPTGSNGRPLLALPPNHRTYPTAAAILEFISSVGILEGLTLTEADLKTLLDVLVFDGKLERMGAQGYRTVRQPKNIPEEGEGNGFSSAPCGRCPVFSLCEEGGPVSASNCVYFDSWLKG
ncbi:DNA-directed RNA polymerase-like protein III subunit Rpc34 [Cryomyces antarcticus]|uniref:DNA-directed RNA polymerase III subunit RPC6 n=1 Tax=Cryomyces antarcticus TaxID=329879 RepID=A0ABR0M000_9PEZI|nr:34-kDa subunit of RNA polymerase III (C) [Cryomyces antarcticus]KAK5019246.1 34-kDa subunit of RNA polymerase III (C) [Cryomyces antarcticus]KAK5257376.1 34-kDa subunit of RNA polymerase III (C) [Cryomyces antarcticus]